MVRPTSETMVNHMFSQWVQSWRDLPLLVRNLNRSHDILRDRVSPRLAPCLASNMWATPPLPSYGNHVRHRYRCHPLQIGPALELQAQTQWGRNL